MRSRSPGTRSSAVATNCVIGIERGSTELPWARHSSAMASARARGVATSAFPAGVRIGLPSRDSAKPAPLSLTSTDL
jgi:hypothetical protein